MTEDELLQRILKQAVERPGVTVRDLALLRALVMSLLKEAS